MKTIQPTQVWYNGQEVEATILNVYCSGDNLQAAATFNYELMKESLLSDGLYEFTRLVGLVVGNISMTGADYDAWETNDYAYDWVAAQLNLTITGEYVPPTPPQPTPEPTPEPRPEFVEPTPEVNPE